MTWECVGESSNCITLVHEEGYLLHGTELNSGDGERNVIIEVTDADSGEMVAQERRTVESEDELNELVERLREKYPE